MKILNAIDDLLKISASLRLSHPSLSDYIVEEFTSRGILHDEIELSLRLYYLIKLNDIRMPNQLENVDLAGHAFNIRHVRYAILFEYFDSHLLSGKYVLA